MTHGGGLGNNPTTPNTSELDLANETIKIFNDTENNITVIRKKIPTENGPEYIIFALKESGTSVDCDTVQEINKTIPEEIKREQENTLQKVRAINEILILPKALPNSREPNKHHIGAIFSFTRNENGKLKETIQYAGFYTPADRRDLTILHSERGIHIKGPGLESVFGFFLRDQDHKITFFNSSRLSPDNKKIKELIITPRGIQVIYVADETYEELEQHELLQISPKEELSPLEQSREKEFALLKALHEDFEEEHFLTYEFLEIKKFTSVLFNEIWMQLFDTIGWIYSYVLTGEQLLHTSDLPRRLSNPELKDIHGDLGQFASNEKSLIRSYAYAKQNLKNLILPETLRKQLGLDNQFFDSTKINPLTNPYWLERRIYPTTSHYFNILTGLINLRKTLERINDPTLSAENDSVRAQFYHNVNQRLAQPRYYVGIKIRGIGFKPYITEKQYVPFLEHIFPRIEKLVYLQGLTNIMIAFIGATTRFPLLPQKTVKDLLAQYEELNIQKRIEQLSQEIQEEIAKHMQVTYHQNATDSEKQEKIDPKDILHIFMQTYKDAFGHVYSKEEIE